MKELRELAIGIGLIILLCLFMAKCGNAAEFKHYQFISLEDISNNADKYNAEEIQTRGEIKHIDSFTGVYGGEYIGLSMDEGIIILVYAAEVHQALVVGDVILVDGTFHKYGKYGGQGHDYYIATHHLERMN